jgi:hypothetical protein
MILAGLRSVGERVGRACAGECWASCAFDRILSVIESHKIPMVLRGWRGVFAGMHGSRVEIECVRDAEVFEEAGVLKKNCKIRRVSRRRSHPTTPYRRATGFFITCKAVLSREHIQLLCFLLWLFLTVGPSGPRSILCAASVSQRPFSAAAIWRPPPQQQQSWAPQRLQQHRPHLGPNSMAAHSMRVLAARRWFWRPWSTNPSSYAFHTPLYFHKSLPSISSSHTYRHGDSSLALS